MTVATGWDTAVGLIFRARVGELLLNTVLLMLFSVPLCLVLGVGGAWLVERTRLRGNRFWALALAAPLAIPAFVNSYGWVSAVPVPRRPLVGRAHLGAVLLPARLHPGRGDAEPPRPGARGVGGLPGARRRGTCFRRVVLPQLRLAMTGGALLVGAAPAGRVRRLRDDPLRHLHDGDHGAVPVDLQRRRRQHARERARRPVPAAARRRGPQPGHRPLRPRRLRRPGRAGAYAAGPPPRSRAALAPAPRRARRRASRCGSSLRWVVLGGSEIWAPDELVPALLQTLLYGVAGAVATTVVAFPMAFLAVRRPSWFSTVPRAVQLRHELDARHRRRPRLRHREHPAASRASTRRRSCSSPPTCCSSCRGRSSACARGSPRRPGARGGRAGAGRAPLRRLRPGHAAPHGAGGRRGSGARVPRHRQRADGDPAALAERHAHPRDASSGPRAARSTTPAPPPTRC